MIIAHRLTTISSANNLLFFRSRSQLDYASKGTREYTEIFEKLKNIAYSYGDALQERVEDSQSENEMIVEESQEEDKEEPSNY